MSIIIKKAPGVMMDKKLKQNIDNAAVKREMIVVWLLDGEKIKDIAEVSADPERVKINTLEEPIWVPYADVEDISRVIRLRVEGETNEPFNQKTSKHWRFFD